MFDSEKLKVGDVFYSVEESNMAFKRNKVHKVIDGEDWFKYDTPLRTYKIATWTVLGILRKTIEGQWEHDQYGINTANEYCVRYMDETHGVLSGEDFYSDRNYFVDKAEALVHKEHMEVQARELDLK